MLNFTTFAAVYTPSAMGDRRHLQFFLTIYGVSPSKFYAYKNYLYFAVLVVWEPLYVKKVENNFLVPNLIRNNLLSY